MELSDLHCCHAIEYCFPSNNASCLKEIRSTAVYAILYAMLVVAISVTVCGNLVVIISISHFKQLHTPTNLLLLSLAVADFLVGTMVMPFVFILFIETCWYFGDILCSVLKLLDSVLISVSLSNLAFIAIDRYFAVCDPLLYSTKINFKIMRLFILCSWLLLPLYRLALLYFNGNFDGPDTLSICLGQCFFVMSANWRIIDVIVTLILPCSIMIGLYVNIFIVATRQARLISSITQQIISTDKRRDKISKKSEQKAAKTLGIVVFVFLFCWVPYYLCVLIEEEIHTSSGVLYFLGFIVYLNSAMNPIIYALFYPWFQKSVKLIITLRICNPDSSLISLTM